MAENTTILLETAGFAISKMNTEFYNTEIRWIFRYLFAIGCYSTDFSLTDAPSRAPLKKGVSRKAHKGIVR